MKPTHPLGQWTVLLSPPLLARKVWSSAGNFAKVYRSWGQPKELWDSPFIRLSTSSVHSRSLGLGNSKILVGEGLVATHA